MKKYLRTRIILAGAILFSASAVFAQKERGGNDEAKKEYQQIIISRKGKTADKTVIEINGDKVKVNGKEITDKNGDITVSIKKIRDFNALKSPDEPHPPLAPPAPGWNFRMEDGDRDFLLNMDSNRAMLGIVTEKDDKGAEIKSVSKESGAEKAGLKEGDVITKINERKIEDPEDVAEEVRKHKPGEKIAITLLRNGKEQKITAELGKWKGVQMNAEAFRFMNPEMFRDMPAMPFDFRENMRGGAPKVGLSIQDAEDGKGVKVIDVEGDSNAAKAGIKENDVITHVNDEAVNSVDEAAGKIKAAKDKASVVLKVLRNGKTQNIEVKIPRKLKTADL